MPRFLFHINYLHSKNIPYCFCSQPNKVYSPYSHYFCSKQDKVYSPYSHYFCSKQDEVYSVYPHSLRR